MVFAGLIPALVVCIAVLAIVRNSSRPTNIHVHVDDDRLVVELRGWDRLYCCRRSIETSISTVEGVGVYPRERVPAEGPRRPGTSWPRVIRAGSFGLDSARDFWDVRKAGQVLVIALKPGAEYRRIVLEVPEPRDEMLRLRPLLGPLDWTP